MKNINVLVTGGCGFLGSHVVDELVKKGYNVINLDTTIKKLNDSVKYIEGSILDEELVNELLEGVEYIFHFAALADIDYSVNKPVDIIDINIKGTTILMNAAAKNKIKRFFLASSVYVNSSHGNFYRISKKACEDICIEFKRLFNLDYTIIRYGSLYGPRADKNNRIYKFINGAIKNNKIVHHGAADERRYFIHIFDAATYTVELIKNEFMNKIILISGNTKISMNQLMILLKEILKNKDIKIEFKESITEHYKYTPYSDREHYAKKITLSTFISLEEGLFGMIKYYKKTEE